MEILRRRIERQIMGMTGMALGDIDYEFPPGDPGLFGPQSVCWRVHSDFTSMLCGGISSLMLQMLHPLALAGVWDHSNFRDDMLGRLRRTSQFIAATTFASTADAERLIERVRRIHDEVAGTAPDGRPYTANDPDLLTWVHVAEVSRFLAAHLRYRNPELSAADQDRYYAEVARIAEALGARDVPRTRGDTDAYLEAMRPQLCFEARTAEVFRLLIGAPAPHPLARPLVALTMRAGVDLLPPWAAEMAHRDMPRWQRHGVRTGVHRLVPIMRWSVRNGASSRARRRVAGVTTTAAGSPMEDDRT
ncbi:oxygenase MpaB family protein [Chromohalobacter sp. HP20-39]|uniref:oxygenase MpaB family protein n=1 Tax=Chromohalobacter sp. HP20-39 TaxID=3079306 RepID=UPI00294AA5E1|nr:oxygenase MpaB family protein [Chromohalobacter sp. HP20-39]MDV6320199.1 oxygenase MpaB family protein [Chromohalobacter sp. HP20-39]